MVEYIKKVTREISENFKGSEKFMLAVEGQKDLNKLMDIYLISCKFQVRKNMIYWKLNH